MVILDPPADDTPKKVLVIGSAQHNYVQCVDWNKLDTVNIVDFEVIVINVRSLTPDILRPIKYDYFDKMRSALARFLVSNGRLIVLSDARTSTKITDRTEYTNYDWCPITIGTHLESGDTVEIKDESFGRLLALLKSWDYFLYVPSGCLSRELTNICGDTHHFEYQVNESPVALNRYGRALACTYTITSKLTGSKDKPQILGPITFLPPTESLNSRDAINLILEDLLKRSQSTLPPAWTIGIEVPGSLKLKENIEQKNAVIASANSEIEKMRAQLADIESIKVLVYGSGAELELIFSKCLTNLGATITPAKYSQEEFVVEYKGNICLVECKGVGKSIALGHVRQLMDYMDKFQETENKSGKGILLGNSWRDIPLAERTQEKYLAFPPNVVDRAEAIKIALVDSVGFFHAYCNFLSGATKPEAILDKIIATNGIVTF